MKTVVVVVAAALSRFPFAYQVGEETKIKLREGYQLAQDHAASQWMSRNSVP